MKAIIQKVVLKFFFIMLMSLHGVFAQTATKLLKEGSDLFYRKDYKGALKRFEKEFKSNPSCETYFWIGSCHFKMEDYSTAKSWFLPILDKNCVTGEEAMAMVNLGSCYSSLKQIDSAHYYYDKAIERYPKMAAGYFNKGLLLYSLSKFEESKEFLNKAIATDSTDWYYYIKRQEISFILGDFNQALHDMLKAQELKPDVNIKVNLAYCYSQMQRYKEADSIYQQIYDAKDPILLNNYGFNKHKLGDSDRGIQLIEESLKLNPKNSYAYRNLAIIALDKGEITQACEYLNKVKEMNFQKYYGSEVDDLLLKHCR